MMALVLCMSACNSDGINSYDSEAESIPLPELSEDEKLFAGRIPMCFLIDDEAPMSWDSRNDYSTPQMVRDVLTRMIGHKCHIIGPSVAGAPNNYPERNLPWQLRMVHRSGMLSHAWSIDNSDQMKADMDGMFTNRTEITLQFMMDHGFRTLSTVPDPELVIKRIMDNNDCMNR